MKVVKSKIFLKEIQKMADEKFGDLVKAVIDIDKEIMAVDSELHADEEALLLQQGSNQQVLWGINLYPEFFGTNDFIEFDSMINLRPSQKNTSRDIDDPKIRSKIRSIVDKLIKK